MEKSEWNLREGLCEFMEELDALQRNLKGARTSVKRLEKTLERLQGLQYSFEGADADVPQRLKRLHKILDDELANLPQGDLWERWIGSRNARGETERD